MFNCGQRRYFTYLGGWTEPEGDETLGYELEQELFDGELFGRHIHKDFARFAEPFSV